MSFIHNIKFCSSSLLINLLVPTQFRRQNHVAESPSGRTQVETPVSYLSKLLGTTTLKEPAASSSSPPTPPSKPTVLVNKPHGWYFSIFIRTDLSGSFHTYPHLGGPFKSLQEVETAIECYIEAKRHKTLYGFSPFCFMFFIRCTSACSLCRFILLGLSKNQSHENTHD